VTRVGSGKRKNELKGVLHHFRVGRTGRDEAKANKEDKENVGPKQTGDYAPTGRET
jgi:hypothetical protein